MKSSLDTPTSTTVLVGPGGEGRMGELYLPRSVLHGQVFTLRKLFVCLVHRPKVKSRESDKPVKTQALYDSWARACELLHTFPNEPSTRPQCSAVQCSAVQCGITLHSHVMIHFPDRKSGKGAERWGALAGFYGTCFLHRNRYTEIDPYTVLLSVENALESLPLVHVNQSILGNRYMHVCASLE